MEQQEDARGSWVVVADEVGRDGVDELERTREDVIRGAPDLRIAASFEEPVEGATEGYEAGFWVRGNSGHYVIIGGGCGRRWGR